jgi:hypothetical protein
LRQRDTSAETKGVRRGIDTGTVGERQLGSIEPKGLKGRDKGAQGRT